MPDWLALHAELCAADRAHGLPPEELERLAVIAALLGRDAEIVPLRERALQLYLADGRIERAVRCGFWCAHHLQVRGELAQAQGWEQRLLRLVADDMTPVFEGMAMQAVAARMIAAGDGAGALPLFERGAEIAGEDDLDLFTLAGLGRAQALQLTGRDDESTAVLDEVMVHVVAGRVTPQLSGVVYCSVIAFSLARFDLPRAREWTAALSGWVDEQAGMVAYRGTCLVHRAEILELRGEWVAAAMQAQLACDQLAHSGEQAIAAAHYRVAELARLQGRLEAAERAYALAGAHGHEVQPGLARLRLAQGRPAAAAAGLRRALDEPSRDPRARPLLLAAAVEIAVAAGDLGSARTAATDLCALAGPGAPPFLTALSEHAAGAVLIADGGAECARAGLPLLRRACALWQELDVPYEAARTRLLIADACAAFGDDDAATMERAAARSALARLAAVGGSRPETVGSLSPRECQVLRLVATGVTNRVVAQRLVLSEKTVARHVSNILAKLGVANRSAATAWAFAHELV